MFTTQEVIDFVDCYYGERPLLWKQDFVKFVQALLAVDPPQLIAYARDTRSVMVPPDPCDVKYQCGQPGRSVKLPKHANPRDPRHGWRR